MVLTVIIGVLFAAIVFFHYVQGFFSATISAFLAIFAAMLAFSYHETIVEAFLPTKAANVAHSLVLILLFAVIYLGLRTIFDMVVPEGVMLPAMIDRLGGGMMGAVAACFSLGILSIAIEELPLGSNVLGYTKYDAEDTPRKFFHGRENQDRMNYDELKSQAAGSFDEKDRVQLFPVVIPGVDELVVGTVAHLSQIGSMQGTPLFQIHPDFTQEIYGQNIGIQGGVKHFMLPSWAKVVGVYEVKNVNVVDSELQGIRGGRLPVVPLTTVLHVDPDQPSQKVQTSVVIADGEHMLVAVRVSFGVEAAETDAAIRLSPGSIRLVAKSKDGVFRDYYPIGMLEPGKNVPNLFSSKPDDYLLVTCPVGATRAAVDAVFSVETKGFEKMVIDEEQHKRPFTKDGRFVVDDDAFIEVKRMFRESLRDQLIDPYPNVPAGPDLKVGTLHPADVQALALASKTQGPRIGSFELTVAARSPLSETKSLCKRLNFPDSIIDYELKREPFMAYVPPKYDPSKPMGLIVLLDNKKCDALPEALLHEFDDGNIAFVEARNTPGQWWHRAGLALDVVHEMQQKYAINGNRIYLFGGGDLNGANGVTSFVAERLGLAFPQIFSGMFLVEAGNFAPMEMPDNKTLPARFPAPPPDALAAAKQLPIIIVKIYQNGIEKPLLDSLQNAGFARVEIMTLTKEQLNYPSNTPGWIPDVLKFLDDGSRGLGRPASIPPSK